ncbi:fructose 1,6-bisphosphatase [Dellaglioa algida]|uniref:Inositol monophosphatase family protein n=1 Tax=Dellaglioa carnosa TaxID=2995136 RepID=A0ABT4JK81_9LACO|nr:inositol monophosphatase family protein [Dellaglioa carnosa]MCZ2490786.1 inositol monophosphatase family protein [Dellaglioa carnosa]MCZ2493864.1 inositol monophosphatase family protein [Dellaglioa carnosa]MDK1730728.1 inositol monophosphatase family protein [Dellaglioa carnosa]TWW13989.1 fructose 1,6-bisphosphatase [Dellaglioa algida]
MNIDEVNHQVKGWLKEARENIIHAFGNPLSVETKSSRVDLVTNMDKQTEKFLVNKIREFDPNAKILGEEGFGDDIANLDGTVWIVDPIDGTMNFVKQKDHFAIMIGIYENGIGKLGFIMDVMNDVLYSGGPDNGVFANENKLEKPENTSLKDGLLGCSSPMLMMDYNHLQTIVKHSSGARVYGSAGIEFIHILRGQEIGYISHLKPWDFAAGKILAEALGITVKTIDGSELDMLQSANVLIATENAQEDILKLLNSF